MAQTFIIKRKWWQWIACMAVLLTGSVTPNAQHLSFRRLSTSDGLSDNLVNSARRDQNGILWIATSEGLNSFDGYDVQTWHAVTDKELRTRNIRELYCDAENRVWLMTPEGEVAWLDKQRHCNAVAFDTLAKGLPVRHLLPTNANGMLFLAGNKILSFKKDQGVYTVSAALPDSLFRFPLEHVSPAGQDRFLLSGNGKVFLVDGKSITLRRVWNVKDVTGAIMLPDGNILASTASNRSLLLIDAVSGMVLRNYGLLEDQYGRPVKSFLRKMGLQADGQVVLASGYGGVYILDIAREKLFNYQYDPLDQKTPGTNTTSGVNTDSNGYVFITSRESGLSFYNTQYRPAILKNHFKDEKTGLVLGGFTGPITRHPGGHFWIGAQSGLIEWDEESGKSWFHEYGEADGEPLAGREAITALCFDSAGKLWIGTTRFGIIVLDKNRRVVRYLNSQQPDARYQLPSNQVSQLLQGPDGNIWAPTLQGISVIDPESFEVNSSDIYPFQKDLQGIYVFSSWFRNKDEVWLGSTMGAIRYRFSDGSKKVFTTKDGLVQNRISFFGGDSAGNVYMCSRNGLYKVNAKDQVVFFNTRSGLLNDICVGVQTDENGQVWIANDNFLLRFDPASEHFSSYDASLGISGAGFRNGQYKAADGRLFWACNDGITYFYPQDLVANQQPVRIWITALQTRSESYHFTQTEQLTLQYANNDLLFTIRPVSLLGSKSARYQYMLQGVDPDWQEGTWNRGLAYQNLSPGAYKMLVRATADGRTWVKASNEVLVTINAPWWRQGWFVLLCSLLLMAGSVYALQKRRQRKAAQKEEAETEKAIYYFASSMHQHSSVEDILWDITRNCISRLHFEDCVIYLVDPASGMLQQKAAWGPKTTPDNKIVAPFELPLGKGIVGSVALTGQSALVNDTSQDPRYVVDDVRRDSELCVPIIADGQVLGVIDSEHSRKHFFTQRHHSILTTIASLAGSKIMSARAEEERRRAALALVENRRRTAEVEMQALRAQMNPHFMFNSLNSINNFILKNDADNASAYLTRFARLMRLILDNSRQDWVSLENELKALQLYIEMESLRFDNAFTYEFIVSASVDPLSVLIPPLIIQPYVENAIWHGLMHRKEQGSRLRVMVDKKGEYLEVKIEDNGVGREAAQKLKGKFESHKKSHGMQITSERLDMVNAVYHVDAKTEIQDMAGANGQESGTCVILTMKYKRHESTHH